MSANNDPTTTPATPPGKPRRPWYRRWYVITPAALAAGIITISAIGGAAGSAKPAPAAAPKSATYPAQAADKALCNTFNTDLKTGDTASVAAALQQATGSVSPGLAKDIQVVVDNPGSVSQDVTNQLHVAMDCGLVAAGQAPPAQGFAGVGAPSQPSSAPATNPAPAASAPATDPAPAAPAPDQVIARFSGSGSGSTGSFTVPVDGNWHLSYEYTNGHLFAGQAENFQVSEYGTDGTPGDGMFVNDLAVGSGTDKAVPVYADALAGQKVYFKVNTEDASWSLVVLTGSA